MPPLLHLDSFANYDHNTIALNGGKFDNWHIEGSNSDVVIDGSYGRNSTPGLRLLTTSRQVGSRGHVTVHLDNNYDTLTIGVAVKIESDATPAGRSETTLGFDKTIISILDGATPQVSLCITPSMRLRIRRGESGLEVARSNFFLHENVYYYIEFKTSISSTSGIFEVRVDGNAKITGTGNTQTTTAATGNGVRLGSESAIATTITGRFIRFDDFYIATDEFLGDIIIEGRTPIADGLTSEWTPSSGVNHYSLNDDLIPNTTDYVTSSGSGQVDLYTFSGAIVPSGSVLAVVPNIYARKTSAGIAHITPVISAQGTVTVGDDPNYLTQEYRYHYTNIWTERPDNDADWSLNFANNTYFGVKKSG